MKKIIAYYDDPLGELVFVYSSLEDFNDHCKSMCATGSRLIKVFFNTDSVVFHQL